MKFYQPIEGLLGPRRRRRRSRTAFGLFGMLGLSLVVYWGLFGSDRAAEARSDRILSLSAPDFTQVLSEADREALERLEIDRPANRRVSRPDRVAGTMQPNQTLFVAMRDEGVEPQTIQSVVAALNGTFDFRRARPGERWEARLDNEGRIIRFRYHVSLEEVYEAARRSDGAYDAGPLEIPTETIVVGLGGTVLSSVFEAFAELGEGSALAWRFMKVFRWDFDLSRDVRPGDTFRLVVEKVLIDGDFLRYGRVLALEFDGQVGQLRAYALDSDTGDTEYFTSDGEPLRRRFLRAPLDYRRISSDFSLRRYHPVLRRYRPHLGIDYAADTGAPVWAIADGRVTFADYRGANGNLVIIQHAGGYETHHAHLSRFAEGLRRGDQVEQGEIIGYVGNTGRSTGPHLHFGVREDGEPINPASLRAERGSRLRGDALIAFQAEVTRRDRELAAITIESVDLSDLPSPLEAVDELPNDFDFDEGEFDGADGLVSEE